MVGFDISCGFFISIFRVGSILLSDLFLAGIYCFVRGLLVMFLFIFVFILDLRSSSNGL